MPGLFIFQLECIARNRLGYSEGLKMMAADPLYSEEWGRWITRLAGSLGERELAEIVYGASQHLINRRATTRSPGGAAAPKLPPFLEARLNKIEQRLKITEMEAKGGIDLTRFYKQPDGETPKFESMP